MATKIKCIHRKIADFDKIASSHEKICDENLDQL